MPLRFRKTKKITSGITLNLSKHGISTSIGPRGSKTTLGRTGIRHTIGIPGTGLSYTTKPGKLKTRKKPGCGPAILLMLLLTFAWIILPT